MAWLAAIPAVAGGVAGLVQASKGSNAPNTYKPPPGAFDYGGYTTDANGVRHYSPGAGNAVPTTGLEATAGQYSGENPYIGAGRGQADEARGLLLNSLGNGPSAAEQMARAQAEGVGQRARSMLASGPYSASAARNAINWQAGAAQQMLPQQLAATLQEAEQIRQERLRALLGMRSQDIGQTGQEMGLEAARHQYALGLQNVLTGRYGLNQSDRQFGAQLAADYQRMMAAQQNQQDQMNWQGQQQQSQFWQNMGMGGLQAAAGVGQAYMAGPGKQPAGQAAPGGGTSDELIDPWGKP